MTTSRRNYLSIAELEEYADIDVTDNDKGLDRISQAEELIDTYVGFQNKFFDCDIVGLAVGGTTTQLTLQDDHQDVYEKDYFDGCMVEIIKGTNKGERRLCTGSTKAGVLTTEAFTTAIDDTSFYKVFQIGKFPRYEDVTYHDYGGTPQYLKSIPEAVKRAVAAQVEFMISKGDAYFASDKSDYQSENIGNYGYTKRSGVSDGIERLIAPKAKSLLRGIRSIVGTYAD